MRLLTGALAALVAAAVVSTVAAAPDTKAPRIVAAAMQDTDRDARADRVRLTYSERVRHARDKDGRYPFRVKGYRIREVGKATGKTILLTLTERTTDTQARPAIAYGLTRADAVTDRNRNQARAQTFRATKPHGRRAGEPTPPPPSPPPPPGDPDPDKDGTPTEHDCAPNNPAVHPKADDRPDLSFLDSNCDGIDGDEEDAVFVSPEGKDANRGTRTAPKREIQAGVAAAVLTAKDVYVAGGAYRAVTLTTGVRIFGGYDPETWKRRANVRTLITGSPEAVLADRAQNVLLQHLTVQGSPNAVAYSAYGIRAIGAKLTLQRVVVRALDGRDGLSGGRGDDGRRGGNGGHGVKGKCDTTSFTPGGVGGRSFAGPAFDGGAGGRGGSYPDFHTPVPGQPGENAPSGTLGGAGGKSGKPGRPGSPGAHGARGEPGVKGLGGTGSRAERTWMGASGTRGVSGGAGNGGGGGGGGGGQGGLFVDDGVGNGGGGGGSGGEAGAGGGPGTAGGGSFGIYLYDSTVQVSDGSSIQAGDGGKGGHGGDGGEGAPGGDPGPAWAYCTDEIGAGGFGGRGGKGGDGGGGGGGAGGPSVGVMKVGSSSATLADTPIKVGSPGRGGEAGARGVGGKPAEAGIAHPVYPVT